MPTNFSFWTFILNIAVLLVTIGGFIKVIKNDLHHVQLYLQDLKKELKENTELTRNHGERISRLEGTCSMFFKKESNKISRKKVR